MYYDENDRADIMMEQMLRYFIDCIQKYRLKANGMLFHK